MGVRAGRVAISNALGSGGALPESDITSVYRNLDTLGSLGLVRHFHAGHGPGRYVLDGEIVAASFDSIVRSSSLAPATFLPAFGMMNGSPAALRSDS